MLLLLRCIGAEAPHDASVPAQGDGADVRGGAEGVRQPAHGKPRESARHQGVHRLQVLAPEVQEIQQVRCLVIL